MIYVAAVVVRGPVFFLLKLFSFMHMAFSISTLFVSGNMDKVKSTTINNKINYLMLLNIAY